MGNMLELRNISWKAPGGEQVLDGIDIGVRAGRLTAVTGPNGSGKSTLLKIIAGLEKPSGGQILLDGEDIAGLDMTQRAQKGLCLAFQQPVRFKGFTVERLLELAAGTPLSQEQACALLAQVGLCSREYLSRQVDGGLSGGEMKRVEICTVLARKGRLLLFDEPEVGIDLWSFSGLVSVFQALKRQGDKALLLVSHQERILETADEILVLEKGKITEKGPPEKILPKLEGQGRPCGGCMRGEAAPI